MGKSFATVMTLLAALLAVAIPVVLAIYLADRQARKTELTLVTGYALDVLHRTEITSDQVFRATDSLVRAHSADSCSDSNIAIMRKFDLASSYLQAIGYVDATIMDWEQTDGAIEWLCEKGYDRDFGARPMKRVFQREVQNSLAKEILAGKFPPGGSVGSARRLASLPPPALAAGSR